MKNVSTTFKTELNNDRRNYIKSCDITLSDGTKLSIENRHIWNNGFKVEDAVSGENSFDIGSAIIGKFTLIINNIYDDFSDYDFTDAVVSNIKVGLKLPDGTTESVKKGIYTVDEASYNGSIITLECLDNMAKFDRSYSESNLTYPATLGAIVRDACSCCGISLSADSAAFDNDDFVVQSRPDDSNLTFRQVLFWVGQISCHWCRCNESGQLSLSWYDLEYFEKMRQLIDGGTFSPWSDGDSVDGGTFSPWNTGDVADGGTFEDQKKYHHIYSMASMMICTDDVVITGVKVVEKAKDSEIDDIAYQSGSDGYVLSIEGNELIQDGAGAQVASYLGNKLNGLRFRPLSVDCLSDPSIEAGDVAFVTDRKGNSYATLITNVTFQSGNYEKISCGAESPRRKSADRYSEATRIYQELRKKLSRNKTEWEKAVEDLTNTLASSSGLFITTEEQEDGSSIYYMHNKKNLSESDIVWKITAEGFGISTDGGKTYPFGFKVTGEMITKILNTIGINADWINTGAITAKDNSGNITFSVDVDTGKVIIHADEFSLTGKSVEEIASKELNDFVSSVYSQDMAVLQNQIDGQIETYYYDYEPSMQNYPASEWTSTEERKKHVGDLFYWKSKGYAYRFLLDDSTWKWQIVQDTDITKALATAEKAQDTADGKRRVFVDTPVPPYDIGDLWSQGSSGELMRCKVARSSGSFSSSDWENASKYTDDTTANKALESSNNALSKAEDALKAAQAPEEYLTQLDIFNKLTNNGTTQGIYLSGGKIHINASYIGAGAMSADYITSGTMSANRISGGVLLLGGSGNGNGILQVKNSSGSIMCQLDNVSMNFAQGNIVLNMDGSATLKNLTASGSITSENGTKGESSLGGARLQFNPWVENSSGYKWSFLCGTTTGDTTGFLYTSASGAMGVKIVGKNLSCSGTKSRVIDTESYGTLKEYCYEMPSPFFGDIGCGVTDENGECYVFVDDMFSETVTASMDYYVFLQKEGLGDLYVAEKTAQYFLVKGTAGLEFSWEIKVRQKEYEYQRLDVDELGEYEIDKVNYEKEALSMVSEYYASLENAFEQEVVS